MKKNNKKGFTLVELVIVVAVMAILVAIAIPTIGAVTKSAKVSVYNSNAKTIESMIKLAQAQADDGSGSTTSANYATALDNAKLGIKGDSSDYTKFQYDKDTLNVRVMDKDGNLVDAKTDDVPITFDATTGKATVGSSTPVTPDP